MINIIKNYSNLEYVFVFIIFYNKSMSTTYIGNYYISGKA